MKINMILKVLQELYRVMALFLPSGRKRSLYK